MQICPFSASFSSWPTSWLGGQTQNGNASCSAQKVGLLIIFWVNKYRIQIQNQFVTRRSVQAKTGIGVATDLLSTRGFYYWNIGCLFFLLPSPILSTKHRECYVIMQQPSSVKLSFCRSSAVSEKSCDALHFYRAPLCKMRYMLRQ